MCVTAEYSRVQGSAIICGLRSDICTMSQQGATYIKVPVHAHKMQSRHFNLCPGVDVDICIAHQQIYHILVTSTHSMV